MRRMEDRNITISITTGAVVKTLVILAIAALIFEIRDIVLIVLTAIVIASALEPGVAALVKRKIPRILSVIAVYVCLFLALFVIFYFFIPSVMTDFATFIASVPTYLDAFARAGAFDQYAQILGLPAPSSISSNDLMAAITSALDLN